MQLLGSKTFKMSAGAALVALATASVVSCGGGGGGSGSSLPPGVGLVESAASIDPVLNASSAADFFLSEGEVRLILAQGAQAAAALNIQGTLAVVDRVGNVLGVYTTDSLDPTGTISINSGRGVRTGLEDFDTTTPAAENLPIPRSYFAISKAVTGAYLSSSGNAFSTRTASLIVQENFYPGELGQPAGPLFGVQFSQLPCGDLVRDVDQDSFAGPKRSPLGLGADPGGFPLYKKGRVVGGIGFISANGNYGLDANPRDTDADPEEIVAWSASKGFEAPEEVRGNRISGGGVFLLFSDTAGLGSQINATPISTTDTKLISVSGYKRAAAAIDGTSYGKAGSGYRKMLSSDFGANPDVAAIAQRLADKGAFVLTNADNANRYVPTASAELSALDVARMLENAYNIAFRGRAQIRYPTGSAIQVTISVVDKVGTVLGIVRTPDAPVFGTDVSLQKARSAMFMSSDLTAQISSIPTAYKNVTNFTTVTQYNGTVAFSARGFGNFARPFYTDGANNNANGPFSRPFAQWSPFSTGLQLDLVQSAVVANIGLTSPNRAQSCVSDGLPAKNGLQIFPGGFPIYQTIDNVATLVGGIGISGDGIDQDDMISFLGLENARLARANVAHAPKEKRIDNFVVNGARSRYVNCPFKPFNDSDETNPCQGI